MSLNLNHKLHETISDISVMAWRNMLRYIRLPQLLILNVMLNIILLLLFSYVFGGAINTGTTTYIQYFLPGFLVQGTPCRGWEPDVRPARSVERARWPGP